MDIRFHVLFVKLVGTHLLSEKHQKGDQVNKVLGVDVDLTDFGTTSTIDYGAS